MQDLDIRAEKVKMREGLSEEDWECAQDMKGRYLQKEL